MCKPTKHEINYTFCRISVCFSHWEYSLYIMKTAIGWFARIGIFYVLCFIAHIFYTFSFSTRPCPSTTGCIFGLPLFQVLGCHLIYESKCLFVCLLCLMCSRICGPIRTKLCKVNLQSFWWMWTGPPWGGVTIFKGV